MKDKTHNKKLNQLIKKLKILINIFMNLKEMKNQKYFFINNKKYKEK